MVSLLITSGDRKKMNVNCIGSNGISCAQPKLRVGWVSEICILSILLSLQNSVGDLYIILSLCSIECLRLAISLHVLSLMLKWGQIHHSYGEVFY